VSTLYLPASARRNEDAVAQEQAQLQQQVEATAAQLNHFNRLLAQIDDHLQVVLAKPNTTVEGLKGGYYHLVRANPGHPAYIKPYEHDDGTWRDLDSGILDAAVEDDLWNDRVMSERKRLRKLAEQAKDRQRQHEHEDRAREIDARIKSLNSTQILVPRSIT
jgi:hypothetical protein